MDKTEELINIETEIINVIDRVRPFIQRDGGDVKFIKYENNIVYIKFFGACVGCVSIDMTLGDGIEAIIKDEIPEVERVVNIDALELDEAMKEAFGENA